MTTTEGEETTTRGDEGSQREHSSEEEGCSDELYGLSMERMMAGKTAQSPPPMIDVKEYSEPEILKQSRIGWKMLITAILIIGLAVACALLTVELRKEKERHENKRQEWTKKEQKYEGKLKEYDGKLKEYEGKLKEYEGKLKEYEGKLKEGVDTSVKMQELLQSKRRLEVDFEHMKKEVDEYLIKKGIWEADLKNYKIEISKLKKDKLELEEDFKESQIHLRDMEHTLVALINGHSGNRGLEAASIAVSNGYAYGLHKINAAMPQHLSISDIQVLEFIVIASSSNQIGVMKPLLDLHTRTEDFPSNAKYFDRVYRSLKKASDAIINIGDPEIFKLFYRNYGTHIVKLEQIRGIFIDGQSFFGFATSRALDEGKFEIVKCIKECEQRMWAADVVRPMDYDQVLRRETYHQFRRMIKRKNKEMARFYWSVVSPEERKQEIARISWGGVSPEEDVSVRPFLPDLYGL